MRFAVPELSIDGISTGRVMSGCNAGQNGGVLYSDSQAIVVFENLADWQLINNSAVQNGGSCVLFVGFHNADLRIVQRFTSWVSGG